MPKFMTYQRPTPVKTGNWGGNKPTRNPFQPVRRVPADGSADNRPNGRTSFGCRMC